MWGCEAPPQCEPQREHTHFLNPAACSPSDSEARAGALRVPVRHGQLCGASGSQQLYLNEERNLLYLMGAVLLVIRKETAAILGRGRAARFLEREFVSTAFSLISRWAEDLPWPRPWPVGMGGVEEERGERRREEEKKEEGEGICPQTHR